ncbi:ABC transporter permease [Pseudonocardia lacus]|uniref:ABC transporter permease n=1 Tax=Pseudonocardia lacus TaxID=2835865 RepID=UPI001BDCBFEE|nr:ABC transporter permease [Pseudonocardia lacus]
MSVGPAAGGVDRLLAPRGTRAGRTGRRRSVGLALAIGFLALLVVVAVAATWIAPFVPSAQDLEDRLSGPTIEHLLGTDYLGRDVLSRLLHGARPALIGAVVAVVVSCALGVPWGLLAGYYGGWLDSALMRLADTVLVFPSLVFAIAITGSIGAGIVTSMAAFGLAISPSIARLVRAGVIGELHKDYVQITRMYGCSSGSRLVRHILPNSLEPLAVQVTIYAGIAVLAQAGLDFLGLGVQIPEPSWGADLSQAFTYILVDPAATLAPGVTIMLTVLAVYRVGDAIRDRL